MPQQALILRDMGQAWLALLGAECNPSESESDPQKFLETWSKWPPKQKTPPKKVKTPEPDSDEESDEEPKKPVKKPVKKPKKKDSSDEDD